jgi:hypothetical protein
MARKFLHVGCLFPTRAKTTELDRVFDASGDEWIRYAPNNWIIWTEKSAADLFSLLKPYVTLDDCVLITGLDLNERNGWMPKWIWDWLDARIRSQNLAVNALAEILSRLPPPPPPLPPPSGGILTRNALVDFLNRDKK